MIKPLRKRHRQAWMVLAFVLPLGIVMAWLAIPNQPGVKLLQQPVERLLPVILFARDKQDYQVTVRCDETYTSCQLEWINKKPLVFPTAVIYRITTSVQPITNNQLVGRIETRGNYLFPLDMDRIEPQSLQFVLYDFIHQQIIDTINFQP